MLAIEGAVSHRLRRRFVRWMQSVFILVVLLGLLHTSDMLPPDLFRRRLSEETSGLVFNFATWEVKSLLAKLGMELAAPQDTLSEVQRRQLVLHYFDGVRKAADLRDQIEAIYSRSGEQEAGAEAAAKELELDRLRSWLEVRQNIVEGILEEQVSAELEAEGFGRWGFVWPPVKFRFTDLPLLLVISARNEISREVDVHLKAGLPLTRREALEESVDRRFEDMRSLVTPIGGLSAYPAMILEYDSLVWLTDTFAHEWAHGYLVFHPLGYNYNASGQMTALNETTASIVGREIGRRVVLAYYPELADRLPPLPIPPEAPPMSAGELVWPEEPPPDQFSFSREMRETRLRVDELLAEGRVEEAEDYMEERRLLFVEAGYNIRKLNQAYFAFHGSYATNPSSGNPIGGQLEWLRGQRQTLRDYVRTVSSFSRYDDLLVVLARERPDAAG